MPVSTTFVSEMQKIHEEAKQALEKAADQMKTQYDKKKRPAIKYQVGDKVWLDTTNLNLPRPKKKLDDKCTGPFLIESKKGASAYTLKLPSTWHIHPTFNESLLTPYTPPAFPNQEQPLHLPWTSLTVKNTMKSRKSLTAENAKSEEKLENHGVDYRLLRQVERLQARIEHMGMRGRHGC